MSARPCFPRPLEGLARGRWQQCLGQRAVALAAAGMLAVAGAGAALAGQPTEPVAVSVVLNGSLLADGQVLHRATGSGAEAGRFWVPLAIAEQWRLDPGSRAQRRFDGQVQLACCGPQDGPQHQRDTCQYDSEAGLLTLGLAPASLLPLLIARQAQPRPVPEQPQDMGGALNYDVSAWHNRRSGMAAFADARVYSPWGHGVLRSAVLVGESRSQLLLAQGVWQIDRPLQGWSAQLGSITVPDSSFGPGLPLTGLRLGSNGRLADSLAQRLLPAISGVAEREQRTEVFIDGRYRKTALVPYGPYQIELMPNVPGRGDIELLSTDSAGVQQRISQPFYMAPRALAEGAQEWSLDAGWLHPGNRPRLRGQPWLGSAAWRRGLPGGWTGELQAVLARGAGRLALGAEHVHPRWGLSTASLTGQHQGARQRQWLGLGHEFMARTLNLSLRGEWAAVGCQGRAPEGGTLALRLDRPCRSLAASAGLPLSTHWSAALALESQRSDDGRRYSAAAASLRWTLGPRSSLALELRQVKLPAFNNRFLALNWTQPLGQHSSQAAWRSSRRNGQALAWGVQSNSSPDELIEETRWQVYGEAGEGHETSEIGARSSRRIAQAEWRAEARLREGSPVVSAGVTGAVGWAGGRLFVSRRIDDAFVVVDVGVPDLPVLLDNREVARTNAEGWAVVTEARALQRNRLGIDIASLPMQYAMPRDQQSVVPALGSGTTVVFDVSDGGISLPVRDAAGKPLPPGAKARASTQRGPAAVNSRSEVFLERSDRAARISLRWGEGREARSCSFDFDPAQADLPHHVCEPAV